MIDSAVQWDFVTLVTSTNTPAATSADRGKCYDNPGGTRPVGSQVFARVVDPACTNATPCAAGSNVLVDILGGMASGYAVPTYGGILRLTADLGGTDGLNPQVVATHLSAPLPTAQGGTGNATGDATTVNGKHVGTLSGNKCLQSSADGTTVIEAAGACGTGGTVTGDLAVSGKVTATSFVSTGVGPWSLVGGFGTLTAPASGQSMIGFGTNGKLQVSENGSGPFEVAKANGNIATATALAAIPQQCSSGYATGIAANGDASCSTPDTVQLAERAAPTGIANFGIFWFDSTCHCPKVIDNNGQAVQLGLTNVFNSDANGTNVANTLEQRNGTNPQSSRLYGTYTDALNYERMSMSYDSTDGFQVIKSEAAGTGTVRGLGFWVGSAVKWAIATDSTFKPFTNNSYNIGTTTLAPKNVYAGTAFDILGSGALTFEPCNDGTTGTSLNFLAKFTSVSSPCAVIAASSDTDGIIGIVSGGSGTSGNSIVTYRGFAQCSFDGSTTNSDYVVASTTTAADCHDAGSTRPVGTQVIGRVTGSHTGVGTYQIFVGLEAPSLGSSVNAYQGNGSKAQLSSGSLVSGNYLKADANSNTADAGVNAGPYSIPWLTEARDGGTDSFSSTANKASLWGVVLTFPVTTTQVTYSVGTADNTANTYDIGIYDNSGNLKAHTGATAGTTFAASGGVKTLSWVSSVTLQPGRYYLAISSSCISACATLAADNASAVTFLSNSAVSVTSGGTLPGSLTAPADSWSFASSVPAWVVR